MPRFRRKIDTVYAQQFRPEVTPWPEGVCKATGGWDIRTDSGRTDVEPGDWVVPGGSPCVYTASEFAGTFIPDPDEDKPCPQCMAVVLKWKQCCHCDTQRLECGDCGHVVKLETV